MWGRRARAPSFADRSPASSVSSAAVVLWLLFAFVTWNVAFDRQVALEAARFAHASVERLQRGEPPVTIDAGYRPGVRRAALSASLWGVAVLAIGVAAWRRRNRLLKKLGT